MNNLIRFRPSVLSATDAFFSFINDSDAGHVFPYETAMVFIRLRRNFSKFERMNFFDRQYHYNFRIEAANARQVRVFLHPSRLEEENIE